MKHLTDEALLLHASGELVSDHVAGCALCEIRQERLLGGLHAAQSAWQSEVRRNAPLGWRISAMGSMVVATLGILVCGVYWQNRAQAYGDSPDPRLTPGKVVAASRPCMVETERRVVSDARAMEVFRRYRIANPKPGDFEVDYLIPPDLGGSGDPDNLWPQPYRAGVWNSRVKDALEDRLHGMVCSGQLDLAEAQRDLSSGWIEAYKRRFRTQVPLEDHAGFVKDRPWE